MQSQPDTLLGIALLEMHESHIFELLHVKHSLKQLTHGDNNSKGETPQNPFLQTQPLVDEGKAFTAIHDIQVRF